ncbi:hypothetical protein AAY473_018863 [Plecturocebus cupreus]
MVEIKGCTVGVLTHEPGPRPVTFLSKQLELTVLGWPSCLCATAATPHLTLYSSHNLQSLISSSHLTHILSAPRLLQLYALFIETPTVTIALGPDFNPASHLIPSTNPEPHDCISLIQIASSPFPHISLFPIPGPDHTWFVGGSSSKPSRLTLAKAHYAVVSHSSIIEQAELIALTHALTLAKGLHFNIYTNSKYTFHILHHYAAIWAEKDFLTAQGSSIINDPLIKALLKAALLPAKAGVIHCRELQKSSDPIAQGNTLGN